MEMGRWKWEGGNGEVGSGKERQRGKKKKRSVRGVEGGSEIGIGECMEQRRKEEDKERWS